MLWLGRDDVNVGQKEEFVRELVLFEDGCGEWNFENVDRGFYEYPAYFLAAAGINEFRECSLAEEIVDKIVRSGFGYFDEEKQKWRRYLDPIEKGAREVLEETIRDRAIAALEELLATATSEDTRWQAAKSLGQIAAGNEKAITALVELLAATTSKDTRWQAAESLGQIAPDNELAITALVGLLETSTDYRSRRRAVKCLEQIAPGNELAITALVGLLGTTTDEYIYELAANTLVKVAFDNEGAIKALVKLLISNFYYSEDWIIYVLKLIGMRNGKAIAALEELQATTTDKKTHWQIEEILEQIAPAKKKAIAALEELQATSSDESTPKLAAETLEQIASDNELAITALVELLVTTTDEDIRREAAKSLGEIAPGNEKAIAALVELLATTTDEQTGYEAAKSLPKILKTNEQYRLVVSKLKHCLSNETYQSNFHLFDRCYSLIWQCAQNLTYPEFSQAWHGHNPDDANPTPPFNPQQLNRALAQTQLGRTVQPYYIDGSQFLDPDNPAPEIYDQMLDQNCPQRSEGEPANMQQFKTYWKQQCRQGKPILIFYEDPQPPAPQGFRDKFLDTLSRCGGSICVLKEGEAPPGLPTFSPADPNLIEKMVEWMESINN